MKLDCHESFILFLIETIRNTVGEGSFSEQQAEQVTRQIVVNYGGTEVYLPRIDPLRRERVRRAFNGRNRRELCAQYSLSKTQFYEIIKGDEPSNRPVLPLKTGRLSK